MSSTTEPQQVFVRNDKGKLWGPITPQTLELLLENQLIEGRIQLSLDGVNFAFPGRFPELRDYVPVELWGENVPPGGVPPPQPAPLPAMAQPAEPPVAPSSPTAPLAGPGAIAHAAAKAVAAGVPFTLGPGGVRVAPTVQPGPGAIPPGARHPAPPGQSVRTPPTLSGPGGVNRATGPRPAAPVVGPATPRSAPIAPPIGASSSSIASPAFTGAPGAAPIAPAFAAGSGPTITAAPPGSPRSFTTAPGAAPIAPPFITDSAHGAPPTAAVPGSPPAFTTAQGAAPMAPPVGAGSSHGAPTSASTAPVSPPTFATAPGAAPIVPPVVASSTHGTPPTAAAAPVSPPAFASAPFAAPIAPHFAPGSAHGSPSAFTAGPGAAPIAPFVVGGSAPAAPPAGSPASSTTPSSPAPPAPPGPPQQGDLAQVSPIRLYFLAASSNQTGLLSLKLPDRTIEIHFRKGNPEYVGSDHADDAVAGFLVREGLATNAQISQATAELPKFGGDLVAALFGAGILNPATAFQHLAQRAQQLLLKAVLATTGSFTFSAQELPSHKAMPLGNRWAVLMDLVRRIPASEIKRRLADASNNPVMKSGGVVPVSDLRLTPQETRALGFIDGVRSLIQLARDLPQDADVFFRLAFVLREMDIVSFSAVTVPPPSETPRPAASTAAAPKPSTPPPAAARPSPAAAHRPTAPPPRAPVAGPGARPAVSAPPAAPAQPTAAPEPPPVDVQTELKNLRTAVAKLKDQNKFEILGLTKKADGAAVKVAYFKLAKTYHPDTVPPGAPPELAKLKAEMFAAVGNAYRTLSDDASRAAYLEELESGLGEVDVAKILHAEELFQKGMILVKAKKFPEAVEMLSEAITENPDEGEFYAWRGYARFFTNPDNKAGKAEADRDIQIALKKNPRCAPAHFFSGQMWKLLGDTKQALAEFKKTLELQPDHLDAQREIRYLKK